jgi:hypothetical protein
MGEEWEVGQSTYIIQIVTEIREIVETLLSFFTFYKIVHSNYLQAYQYFERIPIHIA